MRAPSSAELLEVWEQGYAKTLPWRAQLLLACACPEMDDSDLEALPIGRRDALLMNLRGSLFGLDLNFFSTCPVCAESLESALRMDDLWLDSPSLSAVYSASIDGWELRFRSPTQGDLLAVSAEDARSARLGVLSRCLIEARAADGSLVTADILPQVIAIAITQEMASADPQANVELALICPACAHSWTAGFDIVSLLWKEVHAWAQRTLRDVHHLARAYGWSEDDVLSLSPTRRQLYLSMCRS